MTDIGELLRATREKQGLSLRQVAESTRIRLRFLEAMEDNDFGALGGEVYIRGFLRNYANFLGLDPEPLLEELYDGPSPAVIPQARPLYEGRFLSEPLQPNPVPLGRIVLSLGTLALLAALAFTLWWQPEKRDEMLARMNILSWAPTAVSTETGERVAGTSPVSRTVISQTTTIIEPFRSPTLEAAEAVATPVPTASPPPRTPTENPEVVVVELPTATPEPEPEPVSGVVVDAEVLADSWVRVIVDSGEPVIERTLTAGESFQWIGEQEVMLRVGNAGGVAVTLNGQTLGVLGQSGEVVQRRWQSNPDGGPPVQVEPQG